MAAPILRPICCNQEPWNLCSLKKRHFGFHDDGHTFVVRLEDGQRYTGFSIDSEYHTRLYYLNVNEYGHVTIHLNSEVSTYLTKRIAPRPNIVDHPSVPDAHGSSLDDHFASLIDESYDEPHRNFMADLQSTSLDLQSVPSGEDDDSGYNSTRRAEKINSLMKFFQPTGAPVPLGEVVSVSINSDSEEEYSRTFPDSPSESPPPKSSSTKNQNTDQAPRFDDSTAFGDLPKRLHAVDLSSSSSYSFSWSNSSSSERHKPF